MSFSGEILFLSLGILCNNNCYFCVVHNDQSFQILEPEKAKELVIVAAREGVSNIVFSGGESTMRPYLSDLISLAVEYNYKSIQIQTNGRNLSDCKLVEHYYNLGVTEFSISLHGHSSIIHDKITGRNNSYCETINGIKNIKKVYKEKTVIATNTVIVNDNLTHLSEIVELLIKLEVPFIQLAYVHGQGKAEKLYKTITPRMTVAQKFIHRAIEKGKDLGYAEGYLTIEAYPYCFLRGYEGFSSDITIPRSWVLNKTKDSLDEFSFNGPRMKSIKCVECNFTHLCHGVWRDYIENYGTDEFVPIKDADPQDCIPEELLELNRINSEGRLP